jgi:hypothetical protein
MRAGGLRGSGPRGFQERHIMLQSVKQLYGYRLGATDGDIGHLKDFYFDDQNWAVRYVIADTGSWLPGRTVLISPHAAAGFDHAGKILRVSLTRKQIEDSPSIESHKPVSRQYEEEYHQYYGWPFYWQGDALWGMSDVPIVELPFKPPAGKPASASGTPSNRADAHLRSTQAVNGYHIKSSNGIIGHVCDFVVDIRRWAIGQLVVKTGHRLSGAEAPIPTDTVERISYDESTVFVNLPGEAVRQSPANRLTSAGAAR